jgi:hypothetical protein
MSAPKAFPNPFDSDIVVDPENAAPVDVPRIHQGAFEICKRAYEYVACGRGARSVLLYGVAGCGKTHLLSRLRRWLDAELDTGPSKPQALFVAVRMETSRGMIWRHLRRRFAEELSHIRADGTTLLDAILCRFAARTNGDLSRAFETAQIRDCGEDLMQVLEAYAGNRHRRLCRAWLRGDLLSENQLAQLNLAQVQSEGLEDWLEAEARKVVGAVTRLAAPLPVVFCFDQIEALGLSKEMESYGFFCQMGANLFDTTSNALLISTINADFLTDLQSGSRDSDFQRIGQERFDLQLLDLPLGKELIDARLALLPEAIPDNPINDDNLHAYFQSQHGRVTPRKLIHEARRLFANWQNKPIQPTLSIDDFLSAEYDRLWSGSSVAREPAGADEVLAHGLPIALQLLGRNTKEKPSQHINLAAGDGASTVQIAFGNHANATSLARWLTKVQEQQAQCSAKLCIVRDARLGIARTARATLQRLEAITQSGGRVVRVEAEALAALDAMRRLLATATSGDLSLGADTVEGDTVRTWLKRNLPRQVTDFAEKLLAEDVRPEVDWQPDVLLELLQKQKIVPLEELVRSTELTADKIENFAREHPDRICYFGGARPVVSLAAAPLA